MFLVSKKLAGNGLTSSDRPQKRTRKVTEMTNEVHDEKIIYRVFLNDANIFQGGCVSFYKEKFIQTDICNGLIFLLQDGYFFNTSENISNFYMY